MKIRTASIVLFGLVLGSIDARAQATWIASSGLWSNNVDWLGTVLPTNGASGTATFNGVSAQTSTLDLNYQLGDLYFQNTGALTLNNSAGQTITINGSAVISYGNTGSVALDVPVIDSGGATGGIWLNGGTGTLTLNPGGANLNTYSGSTRVYGGGTLADGADYSFSANSELDVGGGSAGTVLVNHNETVLDLGNGTSGAITIASGKTLYINGGYTNTFSGVISGAGNLEKDGSSTQILTGANTYTGTTTIGTGADLQIGDGLTAGSLMTSGISGSGGVSFDVPNTYTTTYSGPISGSLGVAANSGTGTTILSGNNTYTGATTVNAGTLKAGSSTAFGNSTQTLVVNGGFLDPNGYNISIASVQDNAGGAINLSLGATLTLTDTSASTTIAGAVTGSGVLSTNQYQLIVTSNYDTYAGGTIIGGGTLVANNTNSSDWATGTGGISILSGGALLIGQNNTNGFIYPTSVITDDGLLQFFRTDNITFANNISGTGGVDKYSTGTVQFTGTSSYTGTTTLSSGTLQAGANNVFSSASRFSFSGAATLDLYNFNESVGSIDSSASPFITLGTGTLTVTNGLGVQFNGTISGGGSMVYSSGSSIMTGTNTYTGGTSITGGSLLVAGPGSGTGSGPISISAGGILYIGAGTTTGSVGAATITDNGGVQFNRSDEPVYSGVISGTGTLSTNGGGVQLTGDNIYTGLTSVNSGMITVGNGSTVGSRIISNVYVASGATLEFAPASSDSYTFTGAITGSGAVTFAGPGSITLLDSNSDTYSGLTSVNGGNLSDGGINSFSPNSGMLVNSGGSLTVNYNETVGDLEDGGGGGPVSIASGKVLTLEGINNPGPFTGTISGAGGINIDTGVNSQGLGGANTYTGGTTMTSGEIFVAGSTVGAPGSITSGPIGTNTLTFAGNAELSSIGMSAVTLANAINLNGYNLDNDDATQDLYLTGPISGVGGSITWCTNNILALINTNTFTGTIDMRDGQLLLDTSTSSGLSPNDSVSFVSGIILDSNTNLSVYGGPGNFIFVGNDIDFTGSSAQLGNNDNNFMTLTGNIYGGGSVNYVGGSGGVLFLDPASSVFGGTFTINSGSVYAEDNSAFGSASSLTLTGGARLFVASGVTVTTPLTVVGSANVLGGNGTISSAVTAGSNIILAPLAVPGGGPGALTFSGGLTLANGSTIDFNLYNATGSAGSGFSLLSDTSSGGLHLTASSNMITFNLGTINSSGGPASAVNFNPAIPYSWTFASSTNAISGFLPSQFNLNMSGFMNGIAGGGFSFSEVGNNLELNFTPVPEPSTWALMGAGVLALSTLEVRRRRRATA
jgi:autotransporter-associated beta strand protein